MRPSVRDAATTWTAEPLGVWLQTYTPLVLDGVDSEIVGGLIVAAVLGVVALLWRHRRAPRRALAGERAAFRRSQRADAGARLAVLREQVADVARTLNIVVPLRSTGRSPTTVTFSDGGVSRYFEDFDAYQRAMQGRTVNPLRTFRGAAPVPVAGMRRGSLPGWRTTPTSRQATSPEVELQQEGAHPAPQ